MSLRKNAKPFASFRGVRSIFNKIHTIAKNHFYVASLSGSLMTNCLGNDMDIMLVPCWNNAQGATGYYPVIIPYKEKMTMLNEICNAVKGRFPEVDFNKINELDCPIYSHMEYVNGIIISQIWLKDNRVIDIKTYPGDYVRKDVREGSGLNYFYKDGTLKEY